MARWVPNERGNPVQIPLIECVVVVPAEPGVFEVRAYMIGGGDYYVLFSHPRADVCNEWLDEFIKQTGGLMPPIRLRRTCPLCAGRGVVGGGAVCDQCERTGTIMVDPADIPAEEVV